MADLRPFRGLRYDTTLADPALTIAPPYDVISSEQQAALYGRSPYNIVRVEYGEQHTDDTADDNRYTRAAGDLGAWRASGVLAPDAVPAFYAYRLEFSWAGKRYTRHHCFAAVRLEEWDKGIIKPHEHTLAGPKADRLDLLRATRTQVSPVYCLYRAKAGEAALPASEGKPLYDVEADGQRHVLAAITNPADIDAITAYLAASDVYIADGHHRYETALRYRNECKQHADRWTGDEPENFVLMALTDAADPGLVVLPTHRLVNPPLWPADTIARLAALFEIHDITDERNTNGADALIEQLGIAGEKGTAFVAIGLEPGRAHLLASRDRMPIEALMPAEQSEAWRRLDVSVLQFAILRHVFGIDDAVLTAGTSVSYTQDAALAMQAVAAGQSRLAFLLNPTPVEQVLAVADANGRMPQKSTYFYPKLPTGLVLNSFD